MTNLRISPLALIHLYDRSPATWESAAKTKLWGTSLSQHLKIGMRDNIIYITEYHQHRFSGPSSYQYFGPINEKLAALLIGQPLDCLVDIPEAENCRITHCDGNKVYFQHDHPDYEFHAAPKHNEKSYKARENRQITESYAQRKFTWMSANILKRAAEVMGVRKLVAYHMRNIMFTGDMIGDPSVTAVKIDFDGKVSDLTFANGVEVKNQKTSVAGRLPETFISSLPGKPAEAVIDHWIFAGGRVKSVSQFTNKATISFEGPPVRVFNQIIEGEISSVVRDARQKEEMSLSKGFAEYEASIAAQIKKMTTQRK